MNIFSTLPTDSLHQHYRDLYQKATTESKFLKDVASGKVTEKCFVKWLSEDFYFVMNEVRFMAKTLTLVPIAEKWSDREYKEAQMMIQGLSDMIHSTSTKELALFKKLLTNYDFPPKHRSTLNTTSYTSYLLSLQTFTQSLTALWTLEKVYLDAWRYIAKNMVQNLKMESDVMKQCVEHWTSNANVEMVHWLEESVNKWVKKVGQEEAEACQAVFERVLEFEIKFWEIGEESREE